MLLPVSSYLLHYVVHSSVVCGRGRAVQWMELLSIVCSSDMFSTTLHWFVDLLTSAFRQSINRLPSRLIAQVMSVVGGRVKRWGSLAEVSSLIYGIELRLHIFEIARSASTCYPGIHHLVIFLNTPLLPRSPKAASRQVPRHSSPSPSRLPPTATHDPSPNFIMRL